MCSYLRTIIGRSRWPLAGIVILGALSCRGDAPNGLPEASYVYTQAPPDSTLHPAAGWDFTFAAGRYVMSRDSVAVFEGQYQTSGDTLRLSGETGLPWTACDSTAGEGVYLWRVASDSLHVSAVQDACLRRSRQLTASPLLPGRKSSAQAVPVPPELQAAWNSFLGLGQVPGDTRVAALDKLLTDDAQFMAVTGKAAALEFAADFYCATNGRKEGSVNYQRYGPCRADTDERTELRPVRFDSTADGLRERGTYVLRLFRDSRLVGTGVGRYEVVWVRGANGTWKISRMSGA